MTDILLINPGGNRNVYGKLYDLTAKEPPVWCLMIAGFLKNKGKSVRILDANALEFSADEVARCVFNLNPTLTVLVVYGHNPSASTQVMPEAHRIIRAIKKGNPEQAVAMVGGHVAALPERTLKEEKVEFVCADEGLYSLLHAHDVVKSKGGRFQILTAGLVSDLTKEIPSLPWDMLPMAKYRAHNWHAFGEDTRQPYASIYTTLGCPHRCKFCVIQAPFKRGEALSGMTKNSYRKFSPEWVLKEIDEFVKKYEIKYLKIADELFLWDLEHCNAIADGLIERDYGLNIWAYARVDRLNDEILEKFKKAGIQWLCLGIEAGSQEVRRDVRKGFSLETIEKAVDQIHGHGLCVNANYLFGLPEDNLETMQETLDLAFRLNCEYANFYSAMAYPGSELYRQAVKAKWPLPETWSGYSQHSKDTTPLPTRHISGKEVLEFRDRAFKAYYERPEYLEMLKAKFGEKAVEDIQTMLGYEIERA